MLDLTQVADEIRSRPGRKREQIVATITRLVAFGNFASDQRLPSALSLARLLDVNKSTVTEAYHVLGATGVIRLNRNVAPSIASIGAARDIISCDVRSRFDDALRDARALGWARADLDPFIAHLFAEQS